MAYQIHLFETATGDRVAILENAHNIKRAVTKNAAPALKFTMPADDAKCSYLTTAYRAKVWNAKKSRYEGLYDIDDTEDAWNSSGSVVNVVCSGVISQLREEENISYDTGATALTPTAIITALLALQNRTPEITVGTIEPTTTFCFAVENTNILTAVLKCVEYLGGRVEVDEDGALNWWNDEATTPTREIRYRKNLKGITRRCVFTSIRNRIYAYGYGEGTAQTKLTDAGEDEEYIEDTTSQGTYGVRSIRVTDGRITHPSTLLLWAQRLLALYKDPTYEYRVDVVNLAEHKDFTFDYENFEVGQVVRVVNSDMRGGLSVNVEIVRVDTNLSDPRYVTLELANATKTLSNAIGTVQSKTSLMENVACRIGAGQVTIQGTFTVDGWRATGKTTIDGGNIEANTITTTQLNFTPVQGSNVVASINASTEGITIDADLITISGSCSFASGYDPSSKTAKVGGTYDSASSGARVRIFPDSNTGILITDGTNDVFKAMVGGTDVGDVIIGDYANNKGIKWDKSAGTFIVRGALEAVSIASGKTLTVTGAVQSNDFSTSPAAGWQLSGSAATFMDLDARGNMDVGGYVDASGNVTSGGAVKAASSFQLTGNLSDSSSNNGSIYTTNGAALHWRSRSGKLYQINLTAI